MSFQGLMFNKKKIYLWKKGGFTWYKKGLYRWDVTTVLSYMCYALVFIKKFRKQLATLSFLEFKFSDTNVNQGP